MTTVHDKYGGFLKRKTNNPDAPPSDIDPNQPEAPPVDILGPSGGPSNFVLEDEHHIHPEEEKPNTHTNQGIQPSLNGGASSYP